MPGRTVRLTAVPVGECSGLAPQWAAVAAERTPPAGQSARASDRRPPHQCDDAHLAQRHLVGDPQAFGALVDRYQTRLLTFINRSIGDRERAEALVQHVFIRVFRQLHRFERTETFATWIFTIASNVTKNALRNGL
jgi:hypothetical protein